jgi:phosphoribulokinase
VKLFSKKHEHSTPNAKSKNEARPLMLGLVGDSGCGKSTLVRGIRQIFGKHRVTEICLDDYHLYDRAERARQGLNALDPAANNLTLMTEHLRRLRQGQRILKPVYDHTTGCFSHPEAVAPRPVVIVHGLFTLFTPELAKLFDLSLFLDPEESLRLEWKIARDTQKRGYQLAEVLRQIEERRPHAAAYIAPQKSSADLVVSFQRPISLLYNTGLDVMLSPYAGWQWPRLQLEEKTRGLTIPPGRALEISGRIDQADALRLARAFAPTAYPAFAHLLRGNQPLKDLGLYTSNVGSHPEQRQSLTLALTQWLIAGRLVEPVLNLAQAQVA